MTKLVSDNPRVPSITATSRGTKNRHPKKTDEKEEPTTVKKLPSSKQKKIREAIQKSNMDLAIQVVNENENEDENVVKRIRESGAEMHDNLFLTDYKEFYTVIRDDRKISRASDGEI